MSTENNIRIAKNTLMLYMRMLLTLAITLYTSRIILNTLGVEDFGIYNVVGGFVIMLGFLNGAMATATQRFLSYEIGRKDLNKLKDVFSMSVNVHLIIAFVIFLLAETVGLWFINTQLTIPPGRIDAAHWVFQFSIFTFILNVVNVPYNAVIIAHERMNIYAIVSIFDVSLKLLIVFMLQLFDFDKLKVYAALMFGIAILIRFLNWQYCLHNFAESKFRFFWDKRLFKTLLSYAGWNLWGNAAVALYGQGVIILLNIFFGPAVNAAAGIAYQVRGGLNGFVQNFQLAMNPQIIKSFAKNELQYMHLLIFKGAKYSFFLLFAISLPILFETELILKIWLKTAPNYTAVFTRLTIMMALVNSISGPLMTAAQASGKIKFYQGAVGGLLLFILPISYLFFRSGFPPQTTFVISIFIYLIAIFVRLKIVSPLVNLSIAGYFGIVIKRIVPVIFMALIAPTLLKGLLNEGLIRFVIVGFSAIFSLVISIYLVGLEKEEQKFFKQKLKYLFNK